MVKKIELEFLMSHSVSLFFKIIYYESEYYIVVSISGASDSKIYQINASKAEYMTMMVNSLSHEILTPISEIFKHCELPRIKMHPSQKNISGNSKLQITGGFSGLGVTTSSPDCRQSPGFTFGSQNRMLTPVSRGTPGDSPIAVVDQGFGQTMLNAVSHAHKSEKRIITPNGDGTPFSLMTKQSQPNDTSIKPRYSARSSSPRARASELSVNNGMAPRESFYMINTTHLDIPDDLQKPGQCRLLSEQRTAYQMELAKSLLELKKTGKDAPSSGASPSLAAPGALESMKNIKRIANRIQLFVDGLMGYSQILTQRFEPQYSACFRVKSFLLEVADLFEEKCLYKGITIEVDCSPKLEINTDRKKLCSVFLIFLDNAVKFMNQKGKITLSASCELNKVQVQGLTSKASANQQSFFRKFTQREEESPKTKKGTHFFEPEPEERDIITFKIQDHGMGINKRDMEIIKYTLSNPFNTSPTSSSAGLGIGLRIAQAIISELSYGNGKLEILSQIGDGTTVIFEIPSEPEIRLEDIEVSIGESGIKKSETIFQNTAKLGGNIDLPVNEDRIANIVVLPDARPSTQNLPVLTKDSDSLATPTKVAPPKLQLEFKKSFSKTRTLATPAGGLRTPFDVMNHSHIMQIHSPSFGDLASSYNRKTLPAHMASNTPKAGHLIDDSQMEMKPKKLPGGDKARFSLRMESIHQSKTIRTPDFHKRTNTRDSSRMIKYMTQGIAASLTSLFGQSETKKVMIVDDEVFLLEFLREILESLGLEVYTANSPERAFELSTSLGNMSKKVNLVYMDYNMPNMNGAECTKILKSEAHKRAMDGAWFTVQTAQNDKFVRDQFKAVGVTDFMSKPYSFDQILQHLRSRQILSDA